MVKPQKGVPMLIYANVMPLMNAAVAVLGMAGLAWRMRADVMACWRLATGLAYEVGSAQAPVMTITIVWLESGQAQPKDSAWQDAEWALPLAA